MKSCPACNRTFEDTLTFCLVDGSILSAPFDSRATREQPGARYTSPRPTEVMPPPPPTVPSPAYGTPPQAYNHAAAQAQSPYPFYGQQTPAGAPQKKRRRPLWPFSLGFLALFFLMGTLHIGGGNLMKLAAITAALILIIDIIRIVSGRR